MRAAWEKLTRTETPSFRVSLVEDVSGLSSL